MPLSSYRVESEVYVQPRFGSGESKKIAPEDIKSMQFEAPTVGSYGHAAPTVIFTRDYVVSRSANKRFLTSHSDFLKNGYFSQQDDYGIDGMRAAGEDNPPNRHDVIPRMPDFALIESPRSRMNFPNPRDTQPDLHVSHDIVNAVNPNKRGYFESKLANHYSDLRRLMWDDANRYQSEAVAWIDFLANKGISIDTTKNIGITGLGIEKGDFLAAYYPRDRGYLVTETEFHNKAKHLISHYGLSDREAVEAMKRSVLFHEISHVLGVKGNRKGEEFQGRLQAEFYSMMAEQYKGTKLGKIYAALAREARDYARSFSLARHIWENITDDDIKGTEPIDAVIAKFEAEGKALGKEGQELREYVKERVENSFGAILGGEPSYREQKRKSSLSDKKSQDKGRDLEEIVDESTDAKNGSKKNYERIDRSEYKSMSDVEEGREAKAENAEAKEASEEPSILTRIIN